MKPSHIGTALLAALFATTSAYSEPEEFTPFGEWSLSADYIRPSSDDLWSKAGGGTLKYTHWSRPGRGLAFSIGYQPWAVNDSSYLDVYSLGGGYTGGYANRAEGDATLIPLSLTGVFQHTLDEQWRLNLEAGISYVIVNEDILFHEAEGYAYNDVIIDAVVYETPVTIDNSLMALFSADLLFQPRERNYSIFAGIGAQVDGIKGEVVLPATPIAGEYTFDNELKALFFRFGMTSQF